MSSIDERVVQMKFNNSQFSQGVKQTNADLDALKKGLNLDASAKSLQGLDAAGKKFSLANIASGVEQLSSKFTALSVVGITALANIANRAVNAGISIAKSLTIEPVKLGLQEYETNLNAIQTILANTQSAGTNLDDVNGTLAELNTYADQTIYNFAEMAKNIGTFTAAGVDLDTSAQSIKGIANLAALSGSNSQQASTAMYQLSQAISSGKVSLQDWNSVVNAGMGGSVFQRALAETAVKMGTIDESAVTLEGDMKNVKIAGESFRESISAEGGGESWLTSDVLTTTLSQFTGDLTDAELAAEGFSEAQIASIQATALSAKEAATVVKTGTQLLDTLKEGVGSGWAQTWQTILGDFEEAKTMWTGVSNAIGGLLGASADGRNEMLKGWKEFGGRDAMIDAVKNAFQALMGVMEPMRHALNDIFPPMTGKTLAEITKGVAEFTKSLIPSEATSDKLYRTFKGLLSVLDIGWMVIKGVVGVLADLFGVVAGGTGGFLSFTAGIGDFLTKIRNAIKEGNGLTLFFEGLGKVLTIPIELLKKFLGFLGDLGSNIDLSAMDGIADRMSERFSPLTSLGNLLGNVWGWVVEVFSSAMTTIAPIITKIGDFLGDFASDAGQALGDIDFSAVLDGINTGLFAGLILLVRKFFKGGFKQEAEEGSEGIVDTIKGMFSGVTDTLSAMQTQLKAKTLLAIAGALALLTVSIIALSMIDSGKLGSALGGLSIMLIQLVGAMTILDMISTSTGFIKLPFITAALIPLAAALVILAAAVRMMSDLDWNGLAKGLTGVAVLLGLLAGAAKLLSANKGGLISAGIGMIAIAAAIKILVSAVEDFADLDWEELGRGLTGLAGTLAALAIFTKIAQTGKSAMASSAGLILLAAALKIMASALDDFADLNWDELGRGFAGLGGALAAVAVGMRLMPKNMVAQAAAIVILGGSLKIMASAMEDFSGMEWDEIGRGLTGMAGALLIVAAGMHAMPKTMLVSAAALVVVAAALKIVHSVLEDMGEMSWEEIAKGLVVLAASLVIIAAALYLMTAAIPGALALIVAAGALAILTPVLVALSGMTWGEIAAGLTMLAASLLIIAVGGVALILALPGLIGLGVAALAIGAGALMAGIGLTAMSIALTALAISLPLATAGIVGLVQGILGLIPFAMEQLALGIAAFVQTIADNGPVFLNAMITLILMLLQGINTVAPQIIQTMINLIWMLLVKLEENIPNFVAKGSEIIIGLLNGITQKLPDIIAAATNLIVAFINGIANNLPSIINAGMNLIVKFVQGVADGIRNNQSAMDAAGRDLAWAVADGMTGGLASKIPELAQKAAEMAGAALQSAKDFLGIASPSKEFFKIGAWTAEGMAVGIDKNADQVAASSENMGGKALTAMRDAMSGISDYVDADMELNPTITPILDLSNVQKGSGAIDGLITPNKDLMLRHNFDRANHLNEVTRPNQLNSPDDPAKMISAAAPAKVEFVQNNYSPKALSAVEIYRQTRNQLSAAKGA